MEQHYKILKLAAEGNLSNRIDETSDLPIDIVTELIEAGYLKAIDASSHGGTAYLETKITLAGREYFNELESQSESNQENDVGSRICLFISHSSKDSEFVKTLVELLRTALSLKSAQIRCTSIDGYRLPAGANTDQQLRQEVHEADSFIGVISQSSVQSLFVVFELGARWGAGRPLIPLIAPGTDSKILGGPLAGINALRADNRSQIHQLISDLSSDLQINFEPPSSYEAHLERIFNANKSLSANEIEGKEKSSALDEKEIQIMTLLAQSGDYWMNADQISQKISEHVTKTKYYLDRLLKQKLIFNAFTMGAPTRYGLTASGRAYLVENNII